MVPPAMVRGRSEQLPLDWVIPEQLASNPAMGEALEALMTAAVEEYNRSLRTLNHGDLGTALQHADASITLFPYAPFLVQFAWHLHCQHGSLRRALELNRYLRDLGEINQAEQNQKRTKAEIQKWNEFIATPELLASLGQPLTFREQALLAERLTGSSTLEADGDLRTSSEPGEDSYTLTKQPEVEAIEPTRSEAAPRSKSRIHPAWLIAGAAVVLAAVVFIQVNLRNSEPPVTIFPLVEEQRNTPIATEIADRTSSPVEMIAAGFISGSLPIDSAWFQLQRLEVLSPASDRLERSLAMEMSRLGENSWRDKDYETSIRYLNPLVRNESATPPEVQYRLGVALHELGRDTEARAVLEQALEAASPIHPWFESEAQYRLARLNTGEEAVAWARRLRKSSAGTIYDNSYIRSLLNDGDAESL